MNSIGGNNRGVLCSERHKRWNSVCGSKTHGLISDLLQPQKSAEIYLKDIYDTLEKLFSPKASLIVKRYKFNSRIGGGIVTGLRRLPEHNT